MLSQHIHIYIYIYACIFFFFDSFIHTMAPKKVVVAEEPKKEVDHALRLENELLIVKAVSAKVAVVQDLINERYALVTFHADKLEKATANLKIAQDTLSGLNIEGDSEAKSQAVIEYQAQEEEVALFLIYIYPFSLSLFLYIHKYILSLSFCPNM